MCGSGSAFWIRIWIHKAPKYGSNSYTVPDLDPQLCWKASDLLWELTWMIWVDFRLAKTWNCTLGFQEYFYGRSLIMETLAVKAAQRKGSVLILKTSVGRDNFLASWQRQRNRLSVTRNIWKMLRPRCLYGRSHDEFRPFFSLKALSRCRVSVVACPALIHVMILF